MTKEEKELAKEIFVKSYQTSNYLTDQNRTYIITNIRNSIEIAKLFYKELGENNGNI